MASQYFKPLTIGSRTFSSNLIQGPLAGYSCSAMRKQVDKFGGHAFTTSEMMSAQHLIQCPTHSVRFHHKDPSESTVCFQLSGRQADILAQAATQCQLLGADIIDLNCGCPQPKIRKKQQGSKQIEDPERLFHLVRQMRQVTQTPLTAKIRLLPNNMGDNRVTIDVLTQAGVDAITIHARTWKDDYTVDCDWQTVKELVAYSSVPIIVNGSITTRQQAIDVLQQTQAAGIMISRAGLGQPWLFKQIFDNQPLSITQNTKIDLFIDHLQSLCKLDGEYKTLLQARSLLKYYFHVPKSVITFTSLDGLINYCKKSFSDL